MNRTIKKLTSGSGVFAQEIGELNLPQLKGIFTYMAEASRYSGEDSQVITSYLRMLNDETNPTLANEEIQAIIESVYEEDISSEEEENDPRFKLGSALDAFEPRPPIKFIIDNVIKENSLNSWYGKYGHKKTFVALSAGICVASGIPWIGLNTAQCAVLFIDEESGTKTLLDRLEAGIKGESQNKNIPFYYLSLSAFNFLKNASDMDILKKYIIQTNAKLIFIDALDDVMAGSDENSVKDNQPVLIQLRKICEDTDSAIILLHHENKQGGMRGSTAIPGSLNTALKILSENGSSTIKISTDKMRDSKPFNKNAKIVFVEKPDNQSELESFYITNDDDPFEKINVKEEYILEYMRNNDNDCEINAFKKSVGAEGESYRSAIYSLRDKGIIVNNPDKSEHNKAVYSLVK